MKNILKYLTLLVTVIVFLFACEKDDYTGDSKLVPSNPTITINGVSPTGYNFIEKDTIVTFDIVLSTPQIVDVQLAVSQVAGDAAVGVDYLIGNSGSEVVIPAYATTAKLTIKILSDDLLEGTETFTLQIGDASTANANITPKQAVFTIGNYTEDILVADMYWTTDIATTIGIQADPDDAVDMKLLIIDESDGSIVEIVDGASFESYDAFDGLPDGTYTVAANVFDAVNAGDFDEPFHIDIELVFNQAGVINDLTYSYKKVLTQEVFDCDNYRANLAKVVKDGSSYTISKDLAILPLKTNWNGLDTEFEYPSEVYTYGGCTDSLMSGLSFGWIEDFWSEEIIESAEFTFSIDAAGNVSIPQQYCYTTEYNGNEYPYEIVGSGTFDNSGEYPTMHIEYELIQDGFYPGQWCLDNGYMSTPYFVADLTLEPDLGGAITKKLVQRAPLKNKPRR
jgi:hypothetical protein